MKIKRLIILVIYILASVFICNYSGDLYNWNVIRLITTSMFFIGSFIGLYYSIYKEGKNDGIKECKEVIDSFIVESKIK